MRKIFYGKGLNFFFGSLGRMESVTTAVGDVPLEKLIRHYEAYRTSEKKKQEKRAEFFRTEEGRKYQRDRAKMY